MGNRGSSAEKVRRDSSANMRQGSRNRWAPLDADNNVYMVNTSIRTVRPTQQAEDRTTEDQNDIWVQQEPEQEYEDTDVNESIPSEWVWRETVLNAPPRPLPPVPIPPQIDGWDPEYERYQQINDKYMQEDTHNGVKRTDPVVKKTLPFDWEGTIVKPKEETNEHLDDNTLVKHIDTDMDYLDTRPHTKNEQMDVQHTTSCKTAHVSSTERKERRSYEDMVAIFQHLIVANVNVKQLLPHLHFLDDNRQIRTLAEKDPRLAMETLLDELRKSEELGKWRQFISALETCGYKYIVDNIRGYQVKDNAYLQRFLKIMALTIRSLIIPNQLTAYLYCAEVISEADKQEIECRQKNFGSIDAADVLIEKLPTMHPDWYRHFVDALKDANMTDVVDQLYIPCLVNPDQANINNDTSDDETNAKTVAVKEESREECGNSIGTRALNNVYPDNQEGKKMFEDKTANEDYPDRGPLHVEEYEEVPIADLMLPATLQKPPFRHYYNKDVRVFKPVPQPRFQGINKDVHIPEKGTEDLYRPPLPLPRLKTVTECRTVQDGRSSSEIHDYVNKIADRLQTGDVNSDSDNEEESDSTSDSDWSENEMRESIVESETENYHRPQLSPMLKPVKEHRAVQEEETSSVYQDYVNKITDSLKPSNVMSDSDYKQDSDTAIDADMSDNEETTTSVDSDKESCTKFKLNNPSTNYLGYLKLQNEINEPSEEYSELRDGSERFDDNKKYEIATQTEDVNVSEKGHGDNVQVLNELPGETSDTSTLHSRRLTNRKIQYTPVIINGQVCQVDAEVPAVPFGRDASTTCAIDDNIPLPITTDKLRLHLKDLKEKKYLVEEILSVQNQINAGLQHGQKLEEDRYQTNKENIANGGERLSEEYYSSRGIYSARQLASSPNPGLKDRCGIRLMKPEDFSHSNVHKTHTMNTKEYEKEEEIVVMEYGSKLLTPADFTAKVDVNTMDTDSAFCSYYQPVKKDLF